MSNIFCPYQLWACGLFSVGQMLPSDKLLKDRQEASFIENKSSI